MEKEKKSFEKSNSPPNILFILTDDQDTDLGGMTHMKNVRNLLQEQGTTFSNMYTTTPLCCPSRASILTGRYSHNHEIVNNSLSGNCSSKQWQNTAEKHTFAVDAQKSGYSTYFIGKYLNQYGRKSVGGIEHKPPGWDDWYALVGNSKYYNYTMSDNGSPEQHGHNFTEDYATNVMGRRAVQTLVRHANDHYFFYKPFLMMVSLPAPHSPWDTDPKYADVYKDLKAPRTDHFNVLGKDKHWLLRQATNPMTSDSIDYLDNAYRKRLETLLSVDDLVKDLMTTLEKIKQIDNTYVIFSSDNGYHLGQFSLPLDKRQLYEFDIRVPLVIKGPGVSKNVTRAEPVLNIDIAATISDIVNKSSYFGIKSQDMLMDGTSLRSLFNITSHPPSWRTDFLVEYQGEGKENDSDCPQKGPGVSQCFPDCVCEDAYNNTYSCVRTISSQQNFMYCEFTDDETFVEVYDMKTDKLQMTNIKDTIDPQILVKMNQRLVALGGCAGNACRDPDYRPFHHHKEKII